MRIKQRAVHRGLILIGSALAQFRPFIWPLKPSTRARLLHSWPGPTTWLLPAKPAHRLIRGRHHTVAVRVPGHALARELCAVAGMAIVSTSANRRNQPPALSYQELSRMRLPGLDYILPGATGKARRPSVIIDAENGEFVRR